MKDTAAEAVLPSGVVQSVVGVAAHNRDELVRSFMICRPVPGEPQVRISLPCGHVREWASSLDIPVHGVECRCDELPYRHWFIRYIDEEGQG